MAQPVTESQNYKRIAATTTVAPGPGSLLGIFVSAAAAAPTIGITEGGNTIVNTFTPLASTFYPMPARFAGALIVTIGGTVDCTVFWGP